MTKILFQSDATYLHSEDVFIPLFPVRVLGEIKFPSLLGDAE